MLIKKEASAVILKPYKQGSACLVYFLLRSFSQCLSAEIRLITYNSLQTNDSWPSRFCWEIEEARTWEWEGFCSLRLLIEFSFVAYLSIRTFCEENLRNPASVTFHW